MINPLYMFLDSFSFWSLDSLSKAVYLEFINLASMEVYSFLLMKTKYLSLLRIPIGFPPNSLLSSSSLRLRLRFSPSFFSYFCCSAKFESLFWMCFIKMSFCKCDYWGGGCLRLWMLMHIEQMLSLVSCVVNLGSVHMLHI